MGGLGWPRKKPWGAVFDDVDFERDAIAGESEGVFDGEFTQYTRKNGGIDLELEGRASNRKIPGGFVSNLPRMLVCRKTTLRA